MKSKTEQIKELEKMLTEIKEKLEYKERREIAKNKYYEIISTHTTASASALTGYYPGDPDISRRW